mgnify:CR=1 FL=1
MDVFSLSSVPVSQNVTGAQQHPGDFASAQDTIDWHTVTRAELKANNFAEVLAGRVPAAVRQKCTPVPVDSIYPAHTDDIYTPAQVSQRDSERARHNHENDSKVFECQAQMRTLNDRIYNVLYIRMRDSAPDTLKRLGDKHAYEMSPSEINGTAMLDEILLDAEAKLNRKDDQSIRKADKSYTDWVAAAPKPNCTSDQMNQYFNKFKIHINEHLEQPKRGSVLSNVFYKAFVAHNLDAILIPKKIAMQDDGSWNDPNAVAKMLCDLLGALHDPDKLDGLMPTFQYGLSVGAAPRGRDTDATRAGFGGVTRQNGTTPFRGTPLPAGQKCQWSSCTVKHRIETCYKSAQCHTKLPYRLYMEHREYYDECERARKADAARLNIPYKALAIPTEADGVKEQAAIDARRSAGGKGKGRGGGRGNGNGRGRGASTNFVDTDDAGAADAASINCALFGELTNAVNMMDDEVFGTPVMNDPDDLREDFIEPIPDYEQMSETVINGTPKSPVGVGMSRHGHDLVTCTPNQANRSNVPAAIDFGICPSARNASCAGLCGETVSSREPTSPLPSRPDDTDDSTLYGHYFAVPGGDMQGVRYIPRGAYALMLAPHILPGLAASQCRTHEAACAKLAEMLSDRTTQSRIQAHIATRVVDAALGMLDEPDEVPPYFAAASPSTMANAVLGARLIARVGFSALALIIAAAAVFYGVPSAAPMTAIGSLLSGRAVVASVGGAYAVANTTTAVFSNACRQTLDGVPPLEMLYAIAALALYATLGVLLAALSFTLRGALHMHVCFWRRARRAGVFDAAYKVVRDMWRLILGFTSVSLFMAIILATKGVAGASAASSAATVLNRPSAWLGVERNLNVAVAERLDVVTLDGAMTPRGLTRGDALGLAMSYGAGGALSLAAALATCSSTESDMANVFYNDGQNDATIAPGSIAALQSLSVGDSGAAMPVLNSTRYAIKGTTRRNATTANTAGGAVKPDIKVDALYPVIVRLPDGTEVTRKIELKGCMVIPSCTHNLIPLGAIALEQNITSVISAQHPRMIWPDGGVTMMLHSGCVLIPDATSTLFPVMTRGALSSTFDRHGKRVKLGRRVLHSRCIHCPDSLIEDMWQCTDAPKTWATCMRESPDDPCSSCLQNKSDNLHSNQHAPVPTKPGELVSFDCWSVSVPFVHGRQKIVMMFHDHYSKHNRPYLLGSYVEVADTLRKYHAYAKSNGVTVTKYYTDNAPGFTGTKGDTCRNAAKELGAHFATIAPHVPRQNGTMERQWRTARNDTATTLTHSKMPKNFWWYFFMQTVEIRNYMPWRSDRTMCNHKAFTGRVPRVTHLRALGALCFPKLISTPSKVHERSKPCIHLGRARDQSGYICYDPKDRRIYITPHVVVLEDYFPGLTVNGTDGIVVPPFDDSYDPTAPLVPSMTDGEIIQRDDDDDDENPDLFNEDDQVNDDSHDDIQTQQPQQQQRPRAPHNSGAAAARRDDSAPANPISGRTRASRAVAGVSFTAPPFVVSPLSPMFAIYLCSGIIDKHEGTFPAALHAAGGGKVATIAVDTKVGGYAHDITRENVTEQLIKLASDPRCIGVLASFPCKTWSTARFNQPGPPLLRDIEQPEGILDNNGNPPTAVLRPNTIVANGARILRAAHAHGAAIVIEAPPTNATGEYAIEGREGHAAMWTMPPLVDLSNDTHAEKVTFDQCMLGGASKKPTALMATPNVVASVRELFGALKCTHDHRGTGLKGTDAEGKYLTSGAESYPSEMNTLLAKIFARHATNTSTAITELPPAAVPSNKPGTGTERKEIHLAREKKSVHFSPLLAWGECLLLGEQPNQTAIIDNCAICANCEESPLELMMAQLTSAPAEYVSPMQPCGTIDMCDGDGGIGAILKTDIFGVASDDDGPSHDAAMKGPERQNWIAGEDEEMSKLERFEAYEEVPEDSLSTYDRIKRRAREVIDTLWVLKRKRGADSKILEYKARCVINGRQQIGRGTDVETFSSTVRTSTFKTFCAVSCIKGRKRCTFDVSGAYLQGIYENGETVYARPPPGYRTHDTRGVPIIWRMLRPLYGQADAGRIWQRTIHKQFLKQGYNRSEYDPCYYYKHYPDGGFMGICLYVDDGFCDMSPNCDAAEADLTTLAAAFDIKVKRETDYFLGTNVEDHSPHEMTLSAKTYIRSMLKKYLPDYDSTRPHYTTPTDSKLDQAYEEALEKPPPLSPKECTEYGSLVGALIYSVPCGRPDVAYAVGILARCLTFPTVKLMQCAQRVLVYLAQNEQDGLHFDGNVPDAAILHAYSDSNWTTGHSTTGFILMLAGVCICYSSKRQKCIALSSTEAELIAASAAGAEIVYHRGLLAEMGLPQMQPTTLYVDNAGAVELAKDAKTCHRSRHVLRRFFKVREWQHDCELVTKWIATALNVADMLTKSSIPIPTFTKFKSAAMHVIEPQVTFVNNIVNCAGDPYYDPYENSRRLVSSMSYGESLLNNPGTSYPSDVVMTNMTNDSTFASPTSTYVGEGGLTLTTCPTKSAPSTAATPSTSFSTTTTPSTSPSTAATPSTTTTPSTSS